MLRPQSSSASRDGYGKVNYEHPAQSGLKRNYFGICELQKKMCAVSMRERPPCTQSSKASSARSLITSTRTDYACRTTHNPVSILPTLAPLLHIDDGAVLVESEDCYLAPQDIKLLNHILLHFPESRRGREQRGGPQFQALGSTNRVARRGGSNHPNAHQTRRRSL